MKTHRSAVDRIYDGTSETWCGLELDIDDESLSNEPTCEKCLEELEKTRLWKESIEKNIEKRNEANKD